LTGFIQTIAKKSLGTVPGFGFSGNAKPLLEILSLNTSDTGDKALIFLFHMCIVGYEVLLAAFLIYTMKAHRRTTPLKGTHQL
jgi:hypothetical protein